MNVRQSTLLRSLLDIEHFTPVAEFARMLGCSEKTVRTDVQAVNEHLERGGFASRVGSKRETAFAWCWCIARKAGSKPWWPIPP